jgi:hypothetical protein
VKGFVPVTTLEEMDALDRDEVIEGYLDGYKGEPEPGNNRSRAYWHGWCNGAVDSKRREISDAQVKLCGLHVARSRQPPSATRCQGLAGENTMGDES